MNFLEKIVYFLQGEMQTPTSFGFFHLTCIFLSLLTIFILYKRKDKYSEKQLKRILAIYGIVALVLELLKQISWSFNYNPTTNIITWDYTWYSFPFQLCTTPIYVSLICLFLKNNKIRKSLLSYLSFITILGSIATIIIPDSCFVSDILVNIHTMWLHLGSFVVSIYLLITGEVKLKKENLINANLVFLIFLTLANFLNIFIYKIGILNGETFNMFYISPYFPSTLPIFDIIYENVPYLIFLITYIAIITSGSIIIYYLGKLVKYFKKIKKTWYTIKESWCNYERRHKKRNYKLIK